MTPDSGASIDFTILIKTQPASVFETLTTPAGWDGWLTDGTSLDARPGGEIHFRWSSAGPEISASQTNAVVVDLVAPRRFSYQWRPDGIDDATTVTFEMTAVAEGTQLSLHEGPYPETPSGMQALAISAGMWGQGLALLKDYLEE
jgi:uncharacterized protein YndB with AHSA1/START domain